jgi:hypothetical protein
LDFLLLSTKENNRFAMSTSYASSFDMRGEGANPCVCESGSVPTLSLRGLTTCPFPKTLALEATHKDVVLEERLPAEDETLSPEMPGSLDELEVLIKDPDFEGTLRLPAATPVWLAFEAVILARLAGRPICVVVPYHSVNKLGIAGSNITIRRILRTLLGCGENTNTTLTEISESLDALISVCRG